MNRLSPGVKSSASVRVIEARYHRNDLGVLVWRFGDLRIETTSGILEMGAAKASSLACGLVQLIFSSPGASNIRRQLQQLIRVAAELKILCVP